MNNPLPTKLLDFQSLLALSAQVGALLKAHDLKLISAESCTGGLLSTVITELAGASEWFEQGFVTYSNASKQHVLGVQPNTLLSYGAVSEQTVKEMAMGAIRQALGTDFSKSSIPLESEGSLTPSRLCNAAMRPQDRSQDSTFRYEGYRQQQGFFSVAISGIAGPGGGSDEKPVGRVCLAYALYSLHTQEFMVHTDTHHFEGDRYHIRWYATDTSLRKIIALLNDGRIWDAP